MKPTEEQIARASREARIQRERAAAARTETAPKLVSKEIKPPLCGAGDCLAFARRGWILKVWPKGADPETRGRGARFALDLFVCEHHANQVTIASLQHGHWTAIDAWWSEISDVPIDHDGAQLELVPLDQHPIWRQRVHDANAPAESTEPNGGYQQSFVSQLRWQDLLKLRAAVKRVLVEKKKIPAWMATDAECDKIIEAMGPITREKWLKQMVDRALAK